MVNIKKVNICLFVTAIFSVFMVLLINIILKSEFIYNLLNIRIDFTSIFTNFMFYLVTELIGIAIIGYKVMNFIKKVSLNENGINIIKNRINELKKEMYICLAIVLISLFGGFFIKEILYFNIIFIPFAIIIFSSFIVFVILMEKYALKV